MQTTLSPLSKLLLDLNFKTLISSMTSLKALKMPKKLLTQLMMAGEAWGAIDPASFKSYGKQMINDG